MKRVGSSRVVLYSLNYCDRLLTLIPYVRYSSERSLCHLAELREDDVHLTVVTAAPVDEYTLDYHFRDLFGFDEARCRSARERLTLLSPASRELRPLDALALADDDLTRRLKEQAQVGRDVVTANFVASEQIEELADLLGARLEEPDFRAAATWGSKSGGKQLLAAAGVPVPRGDPDLLTDEASVLAAVRELGAADPPARRVLVKLNGVSWAGAIGNVVVDCARAATGDLAGAVELIRQSWPDFRYELGTQGAIVEELVPAVVSSPSGIGRVAPDGTVRVLASHEQLLVDGQYWGCRYPAPAPWRAPVERAVEQVGRHLAGRGVSGTYGVDFVGTGTGAVYGVEVNLRKVGPSHVLQYVQALTGSDGPPPVHYLNRRLHRPDLLTGASPRAVVERLRAAGLLYDPATGTGVVLHVLGALPVCGYLEVTSIAATAEQTDALGAAAERIILGPAA